MEEQGVDNRNLKKLTLLQLEQMIIHYKSELSQYKSKIKEYEEDYHYSQLKKLKGENAWLKADLKESSKKLNKIQEENLLLQTKIVELKKEIGTSSTELSKMRDWYEQEINTASTELKKMKGYYEQEILKMNKVMERQQKKAERQRLLQKELEGFVITLTEELNKPWKEPKETIDIEEEEKNFKTNNLKFELEKKRKNLASLQKEMQDKITELAFLQMSGEVNRFQDHIDMLVHQIDGYGKNIQSISHKINLIEHEIDLYK